MKNLLKNIFFFFSKLWFCKLVIFSQKPIIIIDIDNTIADSWPTLLTKWESEQQRVISIEPITGVLHFIKKNYPSDRYQWIFLSNRSYLIFFSTQNWLNKNGISINNNLIFVPKPNHKINLLKKFRTRAFTYFDDLSYNHEKGNVKFFENEILYIKGRKNIKYYGYNEILSIINDL